MPTEYVETWQSDVDWASMPDWITTEEAADISGYHVNYIRRLIRQDKVSARKAGLMWWVDRDSLQKYVRAVQALGGQKYQGTPTIEQRTEE